jgi:hypothetical protein
LTGPIQKAISTCISKPFAMAETMGHPRAFMEQMPVPISEVSVPDAEAESFESFFAAEYPRLGRALTVLTGRPAEAEELAQETLVGVYERWDRVRSSGTRFEAYLYNAT